MPPVSGKSPSTFPHSHQSVHAQQQHHPRWTTGRVKDWYFEVFRFQSVASVIAQRLGLETPPECRETNGRFNLTFRRLGASRWPEERQIEYAVNAAWVAREVFAADERGKLRRAARRATVVSFEDATILQGCAVVARWQCVVPADSSR